MNVEILAVGTELLLGQIVNSNATAIAQRLADRGFSHHHQVVVGDNAERMAEAISAAIRRSDALIITGGIGPTQDDITREVVAEVARVPLTYDDAYADAMRQRWQALGRDFPSSNLRQAYRPEGAEVIRNDKGSAPGFLVEIDGCWVASLPGVPAEMLPMLDEQVLPFFQELSGDVDGVVMSRLIRSWGMSEAAVGELFEDLFGASENPTVAFLASSGEIKVRLTARAPTPDAARSLIGPVEDIVRDRLGSHVFGADEDTIEAVIHQMLLERNWTVGTAESATGGMIAGRLTSVPGCSATFRGSIVSYAPDVKASLLAVPVAVMETHGVVSEETALEMVRGARERLGVDVAVSVTGSAGPEPLERDVGTMCVAVATPTLERARTIRMPGDRERVRTYTSTAALHHLRLAIADS